MAVDLPLTSLSPDTSPDGIDLLYTVSTPSTTPTDQKVTIADLLALILPNPSGRITLTTGVPYMTASVTAAVTVYYTPAVGRFVPVYDGTRFQPYRFTEMSQATTDATKSPAAVAADKNYDLFVWDDAGTLRCTRGPAWSSDTSRGTGAGTSELQMVHGYLVNTNAITNGPAAQRGTYVGSIRSNGSSQIDMIFGGVGGAGGEGTILGVWNMYNRSRINLVNFDNTNTWTYTTATWRLKNASASAELNKIKFIVGVVGSGIDAWNYALFSNTSINVSGEVGIGLNTTSGISIGQATGRGIVSLSGAIYALSSHYAAIAPLGFNYLAPVEQATATGTGTWYGDNGGTEFYSIFTVGIMY